MIHVGRHKMDIEGDGQSGTTHLQEGACLLDAVRHSRMTGATTLFTHMTAYKLQLLLNTLAKSRSSPRLTLIYT